jgi:Ulp1 family protease
LTEVKYQKTTRKTNVYTPLFHISGGKTIPLWYNTSAWELFLKSESDFHREFKGELGRASVVDETLSGQIEQRLQQEVENINHVIDHNLSNITSNIEGRRRLNKLGSGEAKTESSDEEFFVTDKKESACKVRSSVFNTTDEQEQILQSIMRDQSHQDKENYKNCGAEKVSWGGMRRILNEGPFSTTNDKDKNKLKDEEVNFYLKNCLSTHGFLKCGQETLQGNFYFFNSFLYHTLLQEKIEDMNCRGKYSFELVESWTNKLINDTNLTKIFIPININNIHWVLIVVDIIQRSIHYYDSCKAEMDEQLERLRNIEHFMNDFETKKRSSKKSSEWSLHLNDMGRPQQKNDYDCGAFICLFCYLISKHQPVNFDPSIIPSF